MPSFLASGSITPLEPTESPSSPFEGEAIGEPSLEGSWRRKGSSVFATLPQEPIESADRQKRPVESGIVFPENGGSFRRKIAGGGGLWEPTIAQGLQEMDVELPDQNPIIIYLKQAFFLLFQMHFLSLFCAVVCALYLSLYLLCLLLLL